VPRPPPKPAHSKRGILKRERYISGIRLTIFYINFNLPGTVFQENLFATRLLRPCSCSASVIITLIFSNVKGMAFASNIFFNSGGLRDSTYPILRYHYPHLRKSLNNQTCCRMDADPKTRLDSCQVR